MAVTVNDVASLVVTPRMHRRVYWMAAVVAAVGLGVLAAIGHLDAGLLLAGGVALGVVNQRMIRTSIAKHTRGGVANRAKFARASFVRLLYITVIAACFVIAFRPAGFAMLFGLALFQIVSLLGTSLPLLKEARKA